METTQQILKRDEGGRVWTPRAQREGILDEFERSGVSAAKFAAMVGVKYPTLANWIQKRRMARRENSANRDVTQAGLPTTLKWVEATVDGGRTNGVLVVQLPGGATIAVNDGVQATLAGELLRAFAGGGQAC